MLWRWEGDKVLSGNYSYGVQRIREGNYSMQVGQNQLNRKKARWHATFNYVSQKCLFFRPRVSYCYVSDLHSVFLGFASCPLWAAGKKVEVRIKQAKKGKERDELFPQPRADLRRAPKVRAPCQQGNFKRRLTCQEVPCRETALVRGRGQHPLQAQGNVCVDPASPGVVV